MRIGRDVSCRDAMAISFGFTIRVHPESFTFEITPLAWGLFISINHFPGICTMYVGPIHICVTMRHKPDPEGDERRIKELLDKEPTP